jgi:hypothetical protein
MVCNMRKCQAPRESTENWTCPQCGNENYPSRLFCNRRTCGLVRPGTTKQQLEAQMPIQPMQRMPMQPMQSRLSAQPFMQHASGDPKESQPGAWTCSACGNRNYAGRLVCNKKGCGKPMSATPRHMHFSQPQVPQMVYVSPLPMSTRANENHPPGSWVCTACQNVNFPTRDTCNAKKCGQPRYLVDGGSPGGKKKIQKTQHHPEGSWVCTACSNINFPTRDTCNSKKCGQPRSLVDGGPPEAPGPDTDLGGAPAGSWICPECQNINYPTRQTCNRRACGAARPPDV